MSPDPFEIISRRTLAAPTNLVGIAYDLNIHVEYIPMDEGTSVELKLCNNRWAKDPYWRIHVNCNNSLHMQRFALAHSLAHYILHRDLAQHITDDVHFKSLQLNGHYESQANRIACDMILPLGLVKKLYDRTKDPVALAEIFRVSKTAMLIRIGSFDKEVEAKRLGKKLSPVVVRGGFNKPKVALDVV